jgi:prevent-host-death family protein
VRVDAYTNESAYLDGFDATILDLFDHNGDNVHKVHYQQEDKIMLEIGVAEIRSNLADVINRVAYGGERVILQRRGKKVMALMPIEDLELLNELEDKADIKAALKARKEKGGITLEQYRKKHGI